MISKTSPSKEFLFKIRNTRKINMVELDIDCAPHVIDGLVAYGMNLIKDDKEALFNYAFNAALKEYIKDKKASGPARKSLTKKDSKRRKSS